MKWTPIINYKAEVIGHFHECEGMVCFRFMDGRRRVFKTREGMYHWLEEGFDFRKLLRKKIKREIKEIFSKK